MGAEGEIVEQSTVLSESEVQETLETPVGEAEEVASLPSDSPDFEVPDKFKGKSTEEVIKSYLELEKFKGKTETEEGGDTEATQEKEEAPTEDKAPEAGEFQKYADALDKNGELSTDDYTELAEKGYTKEQVDEEIEYRQYKKDKAIKSMTDTLGGGVEKFTEVTRWANENKDATELAEFNKALTSSGKIAQQAMLKGLYAEYEAGNTTDTTLHTNAPQVTPGKGYTSEADFFKDIGSEDYKTHKSFAKAVEAKLAKTDTTGWAIG